MKKIIFFTLVTFLLGACSAYVEESETQASEEEHLNLTESDYVLFDQDDHLIPIKEYTFYKDGEVRMTLYNGNKLQTTDSVIIFTDINQKDVERLNNFIQNGRKGSLHINPLYGEGYIVLIGKDRSEWHYADSISYTSSSHVSFTVFNGVEMLTNKPLTSYQYKNDTQRVSIMKELNLSDENNMSDNPEEDISDLEENINVSLDEASDEMTSSTSEEKEGPTASEESIESNRNNFTDMEIEELKEIIDVANKTIEEKETNNNETVITTNSNDLLLEAIHSLQETIDSMNEENRTH